MGFVREATNVSHIHVSSLSPSLPFTLKINRENIFRLGERRKEGRWGGREVGREGGRDEGRERQNRKEEQKGDTWQGKAALLSVVLTGRNSDS